MNDPLRAALDAAYDQAMHGKGQARHAQGLPWREQPINRIISRHGTGFATGQAAKKIDEAAGMVARGEAKAAQAELLGAIVYAAAAYQALAYDAAEGERVTVLQDGCKTEVSHG